MVDTESADQSLFPQPVGEQLRMAREKAKMDLGDVATKTRIPQRHLAAIEQSDFSALPSPTYSIGFVRAYARAVGADEVAMARDLRAELDREGHVGMRIETMPYEPADPARVPSHLLVWTAVVVALLVAAGWWALRSGWFDGAPDPNAPVVAESSEDGAPAAAAPGAPPQPATPPSGEVVLTATGPVWLRVYDRQGDRTLFMKEMTPGESFSVPANAVEPLVRTGRANAIRVTVGGTEVAPLGPPETTISDVGVSAAALNARAAPGTPSPVAGNGAAP